MPDSQFSALERHEQSKTWCLQDEIWRGEYLRVRAMLSALLENGYNVEGIAYVDAEAWKDCVLSERHRVKMNAAAERWMIEQGAQYQLPRIQVE